MSYLEGVHTYIQDQLNGKQPTGNYALETDLNKYLPLSGGQLTGALTINNQTPLLLDTNSNIALGSDITLSGNHMFSGATSTEIGYLHNAKGNIQDQLDALDTDTTTLNEDVTGLGTTLGVVEGEIAALQTEMVGLGVATVANGLFSFANAAGTLISSTVLSSQLANYLPKSGGTLTGGLTGTSGSFTSLTVGGNSVVTATALNPVVTASGLTSVLAGYLPLTGGTMTG